MKSFFLFVPLLALSSCEGISGTVNVPLPAELGGGNLPIVINPTK